MEDKIEYSDENLQIQTYGKRIFNSQTVGEYFLEFLLVFLGAEKELGNFLRYSQRNNRHIFKYNYSMNPHIGL